MPLDFDFARKRKICPKCGYGDAENGAFHPEYVEDNYRSSHLKWSCWECGYEFLSNTKDHPA